ncbi:MAG: hypothetical protein R3C05_03785 [Pirellulaceae bacterium]
MRYLLNVAIIHISLLMVLGCGGEPTQVSPKLTVYVDAVTQEAVVSPVAVETPAVHPETGRRTLLPALYCPACQRWHAVPPIDQINRSHGATKCLKTGTDMIPDGPFPQQLVQASE